jgi:hypothetical protein
MDFVTLTDHDTIAGALELAHLPDTFISEELTAWFKGEPQAVHILCYAITPDDHAWLQAHSHDLEACAAYLHAGEITAALAHPFHAVEAPLTARHRRQLAELFPIWEPPSVRLYRDPWRHRDRGDGRPRRHRHRPDVHRDSARGDRRRVPCASARRARGDGGSAGKRRQVGPCGDRAHDPDRRARSQRPVGGSVRGSEDCRATPGRGRRSFRGHPRRSRAWRRPGSAASVDRCDGSRNRSGRRDRVAHRRAAQSPRPRAASAPDSRTQACRGRADGGLHNRGERVKARSGWRARASTRSGFA